MRAMTEPITRPWDSEYTIKQTLVLAAILFDWLFQ